MPLAFMNLAVEKFLGYSTVRWLDDPAFWYEVIHPDDRERVYAEVASICDAQREGVVRFRWQTSAGAIVGVESYRNAMQDALGTPIGMCGAVIDASERVRVEQAYGFKPKFRQKRVTRC